MVADFWHFVLRVGGSKTRQSDKSNICFIDALIFVHSCWRVVASPTRHLLDISIPASTTTRRLHLSFRRPLKVVFAPQTCRFLVANTAERQMSTPVRQMSTPVRQMLRLVFCRVVDPKHDRTKWQKSSTIHTWRGRKIISWRYIAMPGIAVTSHVTVSMVFR